MNNCIDCEHLEDTHIDKYPEGIEKILVGKCDWWDDIGDPYNWTCENFKPKWEEAKNGTMD